jgi:hypothetical protein
MMDFTILALFCEQSTNKLFFLSKTTNSGQHSRLGLRCQQVRAKDAKLFTQVRKNVNMYINQTEPNIKKVSSISQIKELKASSLYNIFHVHVSAL